MQTSTIRADPEGLVETLLTALCDADRGADLYDLMSPAAIIPDGLTLRPAAQVSREVFAKAHADLSRAGGSALPAYSGPTLMESPAAAGADAAANRVCWFELGERREQRRLILAVGLQAGADGLRVGWSTLAPRVEAWSYAYGLARSLSDYTWMRATLPARPRLLLDASYFRRCHRTEITFSTLPEARFSCRMSTVCCRNDFEIGLAPEAQFVVDAVPWESVEPRLAGQARLSLRADGKLLLKKANEACRFLGAQRQCLLHQFVGHQPFDVCAVFPYSFARTPDGVAVALSPVCPSARQGLGASLQDSVADLRDRLAQVEPRSTEVYRLTPERPIAWRAFQEVEQALLACVSAHELPMRRRLYVGTRVLGAVSRNEALQTEAWLSEPVPGITAELREALRGMLSKILRWDRPVLRALPPTLPERMALLEVEDAPVFARIFGNMLFSKSYSYQYDLTTAFNFVIVLYLLTLVMQAAATGPLPDSHCQELGALGVHGLLKDMLHTGVPDGFRAVVGSSDFGQWLLAV